VLVKIAFEQAKVGEAAAETHAGAQKQPGTQQQIEARQGPG